MKISHLYLKIFFPLSFILFLSSCSDFFTLPEGENDSQVITEQPQSPSEMRVHADNALALVEYELVNMNVPNEHINTMLSKAEIAAASAIGEFLLVNLNVYNIVIIVFNEVTAAA